MAGRINDRGAWRAGAALLAALLLSLALGGCQARPGADPLSLWEDSSAAKSRLVAFVGAATDEGGPGYIPPEERIAVFDLDGTLLSELTPANYFKMLFIHRATERPGYVRPVERRSQRRALELQGQIRNGKANPAFDATTVALASDAFAGLTVEDYLRLVDEVGEREVPGRPGLRLRDTFFLPMLEVVSYLRGQGFRIYVLSGSERLMARHLAVGALGIPPAQVIGSDNELAYSGDPQGNPSTHPLGAGERLLMGGKVERSNINAAKALALAREVGEYPVLAFGNSPGDSSVATLVAANPRHPGLSFMIIADDPGRGLEVREHQKFRADCEREGWIPVSIKADWKAIFKGDPVRP
ncbi:MAG: haloacid dehalogenase-like hydrolase [Succinivibrionaceae bacterium]|nr:haloacid dehalogenase-like hydrolase [Succinivibrionaceae bacterium]